MPQLPRSSLVYEAMSTFVERCLVGDFSYLWPDERVWTGDTIRLVKERFIAGALYGDRSFVEKIAVQFEPLTDSCWRLLADALFVYFLPSISLKTKYDFIRSRLESRRIPLPPEGDAVWAPLGQGFARTTYHYHLKYPQLRLLLLFAESTKQQPDRQAFVADPQAVQRELDRLEQATNPKERAADMRHALLHMMFPDHYERIISTRDKERLVAFYHARLPSEAKDVDVDSALRALRTQFAALPEHRNGFDFYDRKAEWRPRDESDDDEEVSGKHPPDPGDAKTWIFQANPRLYNIREAISHLAEETWLVSKYKDEIRPGDRVFLWESGAAGGIVGAGTVVRGPELLPPRDEERPFVMDTAKFDGVHLRATIGELQAIDPPVSRDEILDQPALTRLRILRQPQGTNFRVAPDEAAALTALVAQRRPTPEAPPSRPPPKPTLDWLSEQTLWPKDRLESLIAEFRGPSPQIVLAGPPGTSKTWVAKHLAAFVTEGREGAVRVVQFHPSYAYEQFIEGLRPVAEAGGLQFRRVDGIVLELVHEMETRPGLRVLVIDEMNRANLPAVFGELMYLFEYRDEPIRLQYSGAFVLPKDLRFIGTMNTADRSIRSIDVALRRRFDVFECLPDRAILERYYATHENAVPDLFDGFERLNDALRQRLDRHHTIGHTFFLAAPLTPERLRHIWNHKLGPLIEEYFFDQPDIAASFSVDQFWPALRP